MTQPQEQPERGMAIFEMPPIPREAFASDEDYIRAVTTSEAASYSEPWSTVLIPDEHLADFFVYLVNHTHAVGMGVLHDKDIDHAEAEMLLESLRRRSEGKPDEIWVDYVHGRPIKAKPFRQVDGGWEWETDLYNRTGGANGGEKLLANFLEGLTHDDNS